MALHHDLTMSLHRCLAVIFVGYGKDRTAHEQQLEDRGHLVLPAHTLRMALESLRLYSYDLLVLDASVPQEDRLEILSAAMQRNPHANVLCIQSDTSAEVPHATAYIDEADQNAFEFALDHFDKWQVPQLHVN